MECEVCKIEFESKRKDAKYCSPKCRKDAFLKRSIGTDNVTFGTDIGTDNFKFYTITKAHPGAGEVEAKSAIREAKYWYDVPLGAIPVIQEGWPDMPEFINGRQYFLWWKNEFKENGGVPEILNPFPVHDNVTYVQAGQESRRWGA